MATRNFWINAAVDGRETTLAGGPRSKDGKWYKYGGWSKFGNDWIVCGNSLKEIQGQISQLVNG